MLTVTDRELADNRTQADCFRDFDDWLNIGSKAADEFKAELGEEIVNDLLDEMSKLVAANEGPARQCLAEALGMSIACKLAAAIRNNEDVIVDEVYTARWNAMHETM